MQLVMVGNQHQRSYGNKTMKAQNTINLGQISGEMKTWNTFILGSKGLILLLLFFFTLTSDTAAPIAKESSHNFAVVKTYGERTGGWGGSS